MLYLALKTFQSSILCQDGIGALWSHRHQVWKCRGGLRHCLDCPWLLWWFNTTTPSPIHSDRCLGALVGRLAVNLTRYFGINFDWAFDRSLEVCFKLIDLGFVGHFYRDNSIKFATFFPSRNKTVLRSLVRSKATEINTWLTPYTAVKSLSGMLWILLKRVYSSGLCIWLVTFTCK